MSYARSPRPLCSITIGIRPRPLGSMGVLGKTSCGVSPRSAAAPRRQSDSYVMAYRPLSTARRAHQFPEGGRLLVDLGSTEHPLDDISFDCQRFEFVQALRLLIV